MAACCSSSYSRCLGHHPVFLQQHTHSPPLSASQCAILGMHKQTSVLSPSLSPLIAFFLSRLFLLLFSSFNKYLDFWFCSHAVSSSPLLSSLYSLPFSLSTSLAVICQTPSRRLLCLNQSALASFRLICTQGD